MAAQSTNVKLQLLAPKVLAFFTQAIELWHPQTEVTFMELRSNASHAALTASHIISSQSPSRESFIFLSDASRCNTDTSNLPFHW